MKSGAMPNIFAFGGGGVSTNPADTVLVCVCGRPVVSRDKGWCAKCLPLYGDEAWSRVGKHSAKRKK